MAQAENRSTDSTADSRWRLPRWPDLRPSPLAAVFTFLTVGVMFALGVYIIDDYRALQLQSHGRVGSAYIDNLLAPYALSYSGGVAKVSPRMEATLRNLKVENSRLLLRIWRPDGTLFYSTFPTDTAALHDDVDLHTAVTGKFVAKLETSGPADPDFPLSYPYFEVYAPIHDPATGELVAVGEIYQDASEILADRAFVERTVWGAIAFATVGVLAMLALTFSQSAELKERLQAKRRLAWQNDQLRRAAERARLEAAQANEQVLNLVGAELHDGPVQILGLMSLIGADDRPQANGASLRDLTDQVMTELRAISAGLILPELADLDAEGVLRLAVERHHALAGGEADVDIDGALPVLDRPRKICLYRVVQEGLGNALRHGDGMRPVVSVHGDDTQLRIVIRSGPSHAAPAAPKVPTWHLGLQGMRRRLEAFGGSSTLDTGKDRTTLLITLPIGTSPEDADARAPIS